MSTTLADKSMERQPSGEVAPSSCQAASPEPQIQERNSMHTGYCIDALHAVASEVRSNCHESSVDSGKRWQILSAVFRRLNDWEQIVMLQNHLADTMTVGQNVADDYKERLELYYDLGEIQVAIGTGSRYVCKKCRCMEGLHRYDICPVQRGIEFGPQVLSNTFTR